MQAASLLSLLLCVLLSYAGSEGSVALKVENTNGDKLYILDKTIIEVAGDSIAFDSRFFGELRRSFHPGLIVGAVTIKYKGVEAVVDFISPLASVLPDITVTYLADNTCKFQVRCATTEARKNWEEFVKTYNEVAEVDANK